MAQGPSCRRPVRRKEAVAGQEEDYEGLAEARLDSGEARERRCIEEDKRTEVPRRNP